MAELPITMDDSIPQQAGPGAGAEQLHAARIIELIEEAHMVTGENQYRNGRHFYRSQGHTTNVCEHDLIGFARAIEREVRASLSHLAAPLAVEDSRERCASSPVVTYEQWRETAPWYQVMKPDPDEDRNSEPATIYRLANIAASQAWAAAMAAASSGKEN